MVGNIVARCVVGGQVNSRKNAANNLFGLLRTRESLVLLISCRQSPPQFEPGGNHGDVARRLLYA